MPLKKKSSKLSNSSNFFGYLKSTSTSKQSSIFSPPSFVSEIFDNQYTSYFLYFRTFCFLLNFVQMWFSRIRSVQQNISFKFSVIKIGHISIQLPSKTVSFVFFFKQFNFFLLQIIFLAYIKEFWCCR